jgi:hypothetical protein
MCPPSASHLDDPRATGFSPFTARSSVDLPDPDRPIRTRISPSSTSSVQSWTPRTWVVAAWISSRVAPSSAMSSARAGAGPNMMQTSLKRTTVLISTAP